MAYKIIKRTSTNIPTYLCESTTDLTELGKDSKLPMGTKAIVMNPYSTYMFTKQKVFEVNPTLNGSPEQQFGDFLHNRWNLSHVKLDPPFDTSLYNLNHDEIESWMTDVSYNQSSHDVFFGLIGIPKIDATTSLFAPCWACISKENQAHDDYGSPDSLFEFITCEDLAKDLDNVKQISVPDFLAEGVSILQSKGYTPDQIVFVYSWIQMS